MRADWGELGSVAHPYPGQPNPNPGDCEKLHFADYTESKDLVVNGMFLENKYLGMLV